MSFKSKRWVITIIIAFYVFGAWAQKNNVQSAANSLKYSEYTAAKKYIDLAYKHPKTSNDPKMWYYRGKTYFMIFTRSEDYFEKIDADAVEKSLGSLINCLNTDERKLYADSAKYYLMTAAVRAFYEANKFQQLKNFKKSLSIYDKILEVFPHDKKKDLKRNNVSEKTIYLYSYYATNAMKDNERSKSYLQKLMELNYNDPKIYLSMCQILLEEKDTTNALSYIEKGRENFYDNKDLIREQVSLYLLTGKSDILLKKLAEDIEYDPENSVLYFIRGNLYEKKKNFTEAENDYLKAIEINPSYFIANYNVGVLYFNQGAQIMNKAKDILDNNVYAKEKAKADGMFKKALPYLETAHEIDQQDVYTLQTLVKLYARIGEDKKYQEMKQKLTELGKK